LYDYKKDYKDAAQEMVELVEHVNFNKLPLPKDHLEDIVSRKRRREELRRVGVPEKELDKEEDLNLYEKVRSLNFRVKQ